MTSSYADGYEDRLRQQQLDEQRRLEEGERIADVMSNIRGGGGSAEIDAYVANDRKNASVDRSLEATLAREEAGLNAALEAEAQKEAQQQQQQEDNSEAGPGAEPQPGATLENEAVHQITSADVKRQEKCDEKIALMIPDPDQFVQSALKGIQTAIQNMTAKLDKFLQSLQSYVDAVSNVIADIQKMMKDIANQIANFMKQIFDKIMEFAMKILNKALNAVVAALPSSLRHQFSDMKQVLTELILCLYGKMSQGLGDKIGGVLDELIDPNGLVQETQNRVANQDPDVGETTYPQVPVCFAEDVAGRVLAGSREELDSANQNIANNVDAYLKDVTGMLAGITDTIDPLTGLASGGIDLAMPDIGGSITSALNFRNIQLNIFGCEFAPNVAKSTIYTFCQGGDEQAAASMPSEGSVDERSKDAPVPPAQETTPFAEPTAATPDIDNTTAGQADPIGAELDAELERARAGDRSGLDDALDIDGGTSSTRTRTLTDEQAEERLRVKLAESKANDQRRGIKESPRTKSYQRQLLTYENRRKFALESELLRQQQGQ